MPAFGSWANDFNFQTTLYECACCSMVKVIEMVNEVRSNACRQTILADVMCYL